MRFSEEPLLAHCVHRPLVPDPALLDFASLHLLQVPDFSGRRLVRTISAYPLPVPFAPRSRWMTSLSFLFGSCLRCPFWFSLPILRCLAACVPPLFPPLCLSSSFFARFPSFPFDSSGLDWSGFSGLSLSFFSPLCCRLFCFVGLCSLASLVTLGCCAWSFWPQRHPLPPPSPLFFNFPLPLLCFSLGP